MIQLLTLFLASSTVILLNLFWMEKKLMITHLDDCTVTTTDHNDGIPPFIEW